MSTGKAAAEIFRDFPGFSGAGWIFPEWASGYSGMGVWIFRADIPGFRVVIPGFLGMAFRNDVPEFRNAVPGLAGAIPERGAWFRNFPR